ncbi:HAMP domain-containing sensor histidine kinase [Lachnospiraceae bacterium 46-15]
MGKIRDFFRRKSIKTAFITAMLLCIVSALLLSLALSGACQWGQSKLYEKYKIQFGVSDSEVVIGFGQTEENEYKGSISYQVPMNLLERFTPIDQAVYNIFGFLSVGVYPICFIFCIAVTSVLFYKRQLQKPLAILDYAAGQIADNNLDFKVVYDKEDEMGKLCVSFEKMRQALQESNEEMWRQMEERKRLNAAFAHDLRTPLTVLKGQSELLRQYAPKMTAEKVSSTSEMMYRHIIRLEEYVQTMGELQRLEDIEIVRQSVTMDALCVQFRETGEAVCSGKGFSYEVMGEGHADLYVDVSIVLRVFENLLANAVRFAKEKIMVSAESQDGYLHLNVSDDGSGFAEKDLENATKPFYKTMRETDNEHFGMGLNICKILCEKHGGYIRLSNRDGAVITAAFRQ